MVFWRRYGKIVGLVGVLVLALGGLTQGTVEENILALVPQPIKQQVTLFEHSPLSQKLIVVTQAPTALQAQENAQQVQEALAQEGFIHENISPQKENIIPQLLAALPGLFSPQLQQATEQKISAPEIAQQFSRYYEQLFSFQSFWIAQKMAQDPFDLTGLLIDKWTKIGEDISAVSYTEGFLTSEDGSIVAGLYETAASLSDLTEANRLSRFFKHFQTSLPANVHTFFMGGMRYTLENAALIKRDLWVVGFWGTFCLGLVFLCFFRTKRALLVYFLPLYVLLPAAWAVQLVFGHISGITLGFGSVVVGLSVDYAIYIYFALQQTKTDETATLSKITPHLWCNFLTSGLCFAALLFSSIEVFRQIAVFALVALSLAFWIARWVLPPYLKKGATGHENQGKRTLSPLPFKGAVVVSLLLLLFGVWGFFHFSLSTHLDDLNSTSPVFLQDKQIAQKVFPDTQGALLFALGKTPQQAWLINEQLGGLIPGGLAVNGLFVSPQVRLENQNRWKDFWNPSRQKEAQYLLQEQAQAKGLRKNAFAPFWDFLNRSLQNEQTVDFSSWYNPLLKISNTSYAVVNIVPNEPLYARVADGINSVFISASQLQTDLVRSVKQEALTVVVLALLFNLIALGVLFKNIKETLFCFIPVILGGCFLFGCLALFKIPLNLFGLIFLPLLIGLGLDYAIFQLVKYRCRQEELSHIYSTRALLAAGFSTLAGFGVLIVAQHAVLFMMGVCALIGIGGTVGVSLFILPGLWKREV